MRKSAHQPTTQCTPRPKQTTVRLSATALTAHPAHLHPGCWVQLAPQRPHGDIKPRGPKLVDDLARLCVHQVALLTDHEPCVHSGSRRAGVTASVCSHHPLLSVCLACCSVRSRTLTATAPCLSPATLHSSHHSPCSSFGNSLSCGHHRQSLRLARQQGCTHAHRLQLTLLLYLSFPKPLSASSSKLCATSPLLLLLLLRCLCGVQAVDSRAGSNRPLGLSVCLLACLRLLCMLLCVSLPACCNMLLKRREGIATAVLLPLTRNWRPVHVVLKAMTVPSLGSLGKRTKPENTRNEVPGQFLNPTTDGSARVKPCASVFCSS